MFAGPRKGRRRGFVPAPLTLSRSEGDGSRTLALPIVQDLTSAVLATTSERCVRNWTPRAKMGNQAHLKARWNIYGQVEAEAPHALKNGRI